MKTPHHIVSFATLGIFAVGLQSENLQAQNSFFPHNLVSDLSGHADHTDPNLVNPWGIALSSSSPFWIADNGTGASTLYNGSGEAFPLGSPLVVTIPTEGGGSPPAAPTGVVFNNTAGFELSPGQKARFIFATEDGIIAAWNGGTTAIRSADNSGSEAIYKGLAVGNNGSGDFLYAANFHAGTIDVFDTLFHSTALSGNFTDPNLPAGLSPFNIQNIGGQLYVTYAKPDAGGEDDVPGPGNGLVDVFDLNGNLVKRLIIDGALNSPWGLAIAPAGFGPFGGDLLVGNFGDGRINAYDASTGDFIDSLRNPNGDPLEIDGLWALTFGNGGTGGDLGTLYFTAGFDDETHGTFGRLQIPEGGANSAVLLGMATVTLLALPRKK